MNESLNQPGGQGPGDAESPADAFQVTFRRSGVTVPWDPAKESLLELAEDSGLVPDFNCRSGYCHTCMCALIEGETEYFHDDVLPPDEEGQILICSSRPKTDVIIDI